jgi:hypothetical protein
MGYIKALSHNADGSGAISFLPKIVKFKRFHFCGGQ